MKDPILIEASSIKKDKGIIEVAKYLSGQALCFPYYTKEFYKYYFKSLDYSFEEPELYTQIESSLTSLIETLEKKKIYDEYYEKACKYLFDYYIRIGEGNKAKVTNARIITKIYPHTPSYLFKLKESFERTSLAASLFKMNQHKKNFGYIFDNLMIMFLDVAWHLSGNLKFNMECYWHNQKKYLTGRPLSYVKPVIYNNIKGKWDIDLEYLKNNEESIYDYFDEEEVEIFKDVFKDYSSENIVTTFYHYYFELYPESLHFLPEHLTMDFDDLDSFGKHFEKYFDKSKMCTSDLMTDMNGFMFSKAVDLAHEFEAKYLK
ncbi:MAG: hypothetical protein LBQ74_13740 [Prevotella sp.]|jgi:hypothetical protein|nr:hypothetical protein [Prevotella sp.]